MTEANGCNEITKNDTKGPNEGKTPISTIYSWYQRQKIKK